MPTILRPQVAIIAIGKAHTVPKYDGKSEDGTHLWEPREAVNFSISADHRILDGASVAHFAARFKQLIENPNLMLLGAKWTEYIILKQGRSMWELKETISI